MKIGIAAATQFEIQPAIDFLKKHDYVIRPRNFEIVITGIGAISTTYQLSKFIYEQKPGYIVQAGIGGTFTETFQPGAVVIIKDEVMGDLGVEEKLDFRDVFDLGLMRPSMSPFMHKRLTNPYLGEHDTYALPSASGITVNEITTRPDRIKLLAAKYNCEIESMEGAALHYVCLAEQIPFIQLRAVSNYIGDRDKNNWKLQQSIENLNQKLIRIIQEIPLT